MSMQDQDAGADEQQGLPPEADEEQPSGQEGSTPPQPVSSEREKELERRLTEQGRQLANAHRALTTVTSEVQTISSTVSALTQNLNERERREAEDRERTRQAYLDSLPADKRIVEEVRLLKDEVKTLRQPPRTAVQPAQPAARASSDDQEVAYMRQRAHEIIARANSRYGVELTQEDFKRLPEAAWESEDTFHDAVYDLAASKQPGGESVANKPNKEESPEERTRRIVREEIGGGSPATPRAAAAKGKAPTSDDVKGIANAYDSAQGPKANIRKLKEAREKLGMK